MRATLAVIASAVLTAALCGTVVAGNLDSPGAPTAGSGMYTLSDIYNYMNSGIVVPTPGTFNEPASGPTVATMKTTKEIYDDIKSKLEQCEARPENVTPGIRYFSTVPGWWGVRTGGTPMPTATPTITATPTMTPTWACGTPITDSRDNKQYSTVLISGQCWMGKNLDYNNGGCLGKPMTDESASACNYYPGGPYGTEGLLYQWNTLAGACPAGWHIPTDSEWCALETALKDSGQSCDCNRNEANDCASAGNKLRVGGASGFEWPTAGLWQVTGGYGLRGSGGGMWTGTQGGQGAYSRVLSSDSGIERNSRTLMRGYSVRCLKD